MSTDPMALTHEILRRIKAARVAFAAEGLSQRAADVFIHLGYWEPLALYGPWEDESERLGLGSLVAASPCDDATREELRLYIKSTEWPD